MICWERLLGISIIIIVGLLFILVLVATYMSVYNKSTHEKKSRRHLDAILVFVAGTIGAFIISGLIHLSSYLISKC